MVSIPFAGVFIGGFIYSIVGSKINPSWTIFIAKIGQMLVTLLMFVENRYTQLFARLIFGMGIALTSPSSMSLITECTPSSHRDRVVPIPANAFNVTQVIVFQMSSLVSRGFIPYQTILGLQLLLLLLDITIGYIVLPFHKGTTYFLSKGDEATPRKLLSSYLTEEQVNASITEAREIVRMKQSTTSVPGEIKVGFFTELGISIGYVLLFCGTSIFATHLFFSFFYVTQDLDDDSESSFVS